MRNELEEWLSLKMVSGQYSAGLVNELTAHYVNRTLHVHVVLDEIGALEGAEGCKPSLTKAATMFRGPLLSGLWHKHFMQPGYIWKNLQNYWTVTRFKDAVSNVPKEQLAHHLAINGYTQRAGNSSLTGEWIVYAKHEGRNYYLTLGKHSDEDRRIWERCAACAAEFTELVILTEVRA